MTTHQLQSERPWSILLPFVYAVNPTFFFVLSWIIILTLLSSPPEFSHPVEKIRRHRKLPKLHISISPSQCPSGPFPSFVVIFFCRRRGEGKKAKGGETHNCPSNENNHKISWITQRPTATARFFPDAEGYDSRTRAPPYQFIYSSGAVDKATTPILSWIYTLVRIE